MNKKGITQKSQRARVYVFVCVTISDNANKLCVGVWGVVTVVQKAICSIKKCDATRTLLAALSLALFALFFPADHDHTGSACAFARIRRPELTRLGFFPVIITSPQTMTIQ
jgi:hypothetical protein